MCYERMCYERVIYGPETTALAAAHLPWALLPDNRERNREKTENREQKKREKQRNREQKKEKNRERTENSHKERETDKVRVKLTKGEGKVKGK